MESFNGIAGMEMESNLLSGHHQVQESNNNRVNPPPPHDLIQMENPPDHQSVLLPPSEDEMEAKRLKRILASRQYSQKYRYKQLQNTLDLQRQLKSLEANINAVKPKIKQADHSILMLGMENTSMKLQISTYTDVLLSKEAECEKLRMERDMLKQLHLTYYPEQQQDRLLPTPTEVTQVASHVNSFNFDI